MSKRSSDIKKIGQVYCVDIRHIQNKKLPKVLTHVLFQSRGTRLHVAGKWLLGIGCILLGSVNNL